MKYAAVALCLTVLLSGCAATGTQVQESELSQFQKGVTTEAQVEKALGAPQSTALASEGTRTISYIYAHAQVKGATFVPIVGLLAGGATGKSTTVTFQFGPDGKLLGYSSSASNTDVHTY